MATLAGEKLSIAASMGLQNLQHEPQRLAIEAERLNTELESLVMDNYRVFVENLTCSVHLRNEDKKLGEIASELGKELHDLGAQCSNFREKVQAFVASYKRNRKTLQHHMQLVELLEVPQLVDACARNGFHDEALELANFVNGLERRHLLATEVRSIEGQSRGGSDVVQNIVDEVQFTLLGLRQQLLQLLTEQSSLPKEIQILATLRKLDSLLIDRQLALERHENESLSHLPEKDREALRNHILKCAETRLQMDFLEARTLWLEKITDKALNGGMGAAAALEQSIEGYTATASASASASASGSSMDTTSINLAKPSGAILGPYGKLMEMLEINRTSWFAVVTQFNALFHDSFSSSSSDDEKTSSNSSFSFSSSSVHPPSSLLNAWITRQIQKLISDIQSFLPGIEDGASLRSVLEQSLYFANRMGQVGSDFTGLILPLFCKAILDRITDSWEATFTHFKVMIATEKFILESEDSSRNEQIIPLYLKQELNDADDKASASPMPVRRSGHDDVPAPASLLAFPPLAYLLNSFLSVFNLLRECPIVSLREEVIDKLKVLLEDCTGYIVQQSEGIETRGAKYLNEKSITTNTTTATSNQNQTNGDNSSSNLKLNELYASKFICEFVPHILVCFQQIFNPSKTQGKKGKEIVVKISDPTNGSDLTLLKERLSSDLLDIFNACLESFKKANLIKAQKTSDK